jgi:DNA-binding MarR family transcriptional regulator
MTERQLRTWEKLQDVTELLRREVGRELWNDAGLSEAEFTVLAHLSMAPLGTARPSVCARAIGWDSSRLAHQLRRLEKRGFVAKEASDAADGRASLIALTDGGRTAYRRALGPHLRSAQKWFADALSDRQVENLADALDALLGHGAALAAVHAQDGGPAEEPGAGAGR